MLKFARKNGSLSAATTSTSTVSSMRPIINRKSSFVTSECGFSKANVVLKNVTLPLAWPSDEYFGNKREKRIFTVQLIIKTGDGKEIFSKPIENVDSTCIDCVFDDVFYIENQPADFNLELTVFCRRTDENAAANFVQTFSRSIGRSVANSLKRYVQTMNTTKLSQLHQADVGYLENYRDSGRMFVLATATFRLKNASLSGKKHNYALRLTTRGVRAGAVQSHLLPLFGQISLLLLVQPLSLSVPIAQGTLDVFYVEGGILLQKLFCILQGTFLKCYNSDPKLVTHQAKPDMNLPINKFTTIELTGIPTALRLKLTDPPTREPRHFICVANTQSAYIGWKDALKLQIRDSEVWGEFALALSNPHGAVIPPRPPRPGTLARNVRFEGTTGSQTATVNAFAPEARYAIESQSIRRTRAPLTLETFNHVTRPFGNSTVDDKGPVASLIASSQRKPAFKSRANLQAVTNKSNVISLKIGYDDDLPPPSFAHANETSSSDSSVDQSSTPEQGLSTLLVEQTSQKSEEREETRVRFVYGMGTGLQLVRDRPTPAITRSRTLYNPQNKNYFTRL